MQDKTNITCHYSGKSFLPPVFSFSIVEVADITAIDTSLHTDDVLTYDQLHLRNMQDV